MSAYIVSDATIGALVAYAHKHCQHALNGNRPTDVGQLLLNENQRSVNHRYSQTDTAPSYCHRLSTKLQRPVVILKLCDHYEYQASETSDYESTAAAKLIVSIRDAAIRNLPGYKAAPWGLA